MDRSKQIGEDKVLKLLLKFSIPAIVGMLVNALYNVVDRIFVGWGVGYEGIAGITVGFPISIIGMAFSMLIGFGSNSLFAIKLGENKKDEAEKIFGNALTLLVSVSAVIAVTGLYFLDPMLKMIGASENIIPHARSYYSIILWGAPFAAIGMGMNTFIRSEGNPFVAMATMLIGAILNTILDPIFIFVFNLGIKGAAYATILSQAVSATWVLLYFFQGRSSTKFYPKNLILDPPLVARALAIGAAPFSMQIASSFINVILNRSLSYYGDISQYGGDVAISGMGILNSIVMLILMPIFGINQGAQPIIGYNYGARKFDRVKQALTYAIIGATSIVTLGFIIVRLFPSQIISLFGENEPALIDFGTLALRTFLIFLPIVGFQIVGSSYFQAVGKPLYAGFLSLSRQVLLLIPALLILPGFFGLKGVLYAGPAADLGSSILTGVLLYLELKKLDLKHANEVKSNSQL